MEEGTLETYAPRCSMPAELHHPYSKFSDWKFKLFRVRSMERAPLPGEMQLERGALSDVVASAPLGETVGDVVGLPGSVMKLCLGGKSKENIEGPGKRVDLKLQEMDTHMNHLRSVEEVECFLISNKLRNVVSFCLKHTGRSERQTFGLCNILMLMCVCRCLCRLCGGALRKAKGPEHEVQGLLDEASRSALRRMGCKATSWPEVILKVFKVDVAGDMETIQPHPSASAAGR